MLFVSNDLPCRSHRKPCTLQDRLGPPRMIASLALQDRLAGAIASLESWVWVGGFCKIGSRLWVGFSSLKWFYGHRYELIGVALAYGCGLIDLVGLWFGFGWVWFVVGRWWRRWWRVFFFFFWLWLVVVSGCGYAGGGEKVNFIFSIQKSFCFCFDVLLMIIFV